MLNFSSLIARKKRTRSRFGNTGYLSLEQRRLLANLAINHAFITNSAFTLTPLAPVEGQLMTVAAEIESTELPSDASYDVEFRVNGILVDVNDVTLGAGESSSTFVTSSYGPSYGSYHAPSGLSLAEIWIDVNNDIAETNEDDNYYSFEFTPSHPDLPMKFEWPFGGEMFTENLIHYYPDLDPTHGRLDYGGNDGSLSGGLSIAVGPATHERIDQGIPIYAAADGEVIFVRDGGADRYTPGISSPYDNRVRLLHGGDQLWQSIYGLLRRDSIRVNDGDFVVAGQLLGYAGASPYNPTPHSYFTLIGNSSFVDPTVALDSYFVDPPRYAFDVPTVTTSWITNYEDTKNHSLEGISEYRQFSHWRAHDPVVGGVFSGLLKDTDITFRWIKPNSSLHFEETITTEYNRTRSIHTSTTALETFSDIGVWGVEILIDGELKATESFEVISVGLPEIRVETADRRLVPHGRFSPFDLGVHGVNDDEQVMEFRVVNHGTGMLQTPTIRIPDGFRMHGTLKKTLNAGESDTFGIKLDHEISGYRLGQLSILSDDPDEPETIFFVEGAVTATVSSFPSTNHFTLRSADRAVVEGNSVFVKLQVPNSLNEVREFDLDYDTETFQGPTRVSLPNWSTQLLFELTPVADFIPDTAQLHTISATFDGPHSETASFELNVQDFNLQGTEGDDIVRVNLGPTVTVEVNSQSYELPNSLSTLNFDAMGGNDQLFLSDDGNDDIVTLAPGTIALEGVFDFMGVSFESMEVTSGGGNDYASIVGSATQDVLDSTLNSTTLSGPGYSITTIGYQDTSVQATTGNDVAFFVGTELDDSFFLSAESTKLETGNRSLNAFGFAEVSIGAPGDGADRILFFGTEANDQIDVVISDALDIAFATVNFSIDKEFESIELDGREGENTINVKGSERDESLALAPRTFTLEGGFVLTGVGFRSIKIEGGGGQDEVVFTGSEVSDTFRSTGGLDRMWSFEDDYSNSAFQFGQVRAMPGDGIDNAYLIDTDSDDQLYMRPDLAILQSPGRRVVAAQFENTNAIARFGGRDEALLHGSDARDGLFANPDSSTILGDGFSISATSFEQVIANLKSGNDYSNMVGSSEHERFNASPDYAMMQWDTNKIRVVGSETVTLSSESGESDYVTLFDSPTDDGVHATPDKVSLYSLNDPAYLIRALNFDRVAVISSTGMDRANFYGSDQRDTFNARPNSAWLSGDGFFNHVVGFQQVISNGGVDDVAIFRGSADAESFFGSMGHSSLTGIGFNHIANDYPKVTAYLDQGGEDRRVLRGSEAVDNFIGIRDIALIHNEFYSVHTKGLSPVTAISKGIGDLLATRDIEFELTQIGDWN